MVDPLEQPEFKARQQQAESRVLVEILRNIPGHWREVSLELNGKYSNETGARSVSHRLTNLITGEEIEDFTEGMFLASNLLHALYIRYELEWERCIVSMRLDDAAEIDWFEVRYL